MIAIVKKTNDSYYRTVENLILMIQISNQIKYIDKAYTSFLF